MILKVIQCWGQLEGLSKSVQLTYVAVDRKANMELLETLLCLIRYQHAVCMQ